MSVTAISATTTSNATKPADNICYNFAGTKDSNANAKLCGKKYEVTTKNIDCVSDARKSATLRSLIWDIYPNATVNQVNDLAQKCQAWFNAGTKFFLNI